MEAGPSEILSVPDRRRNPSSDRRRRRRTLDRHARRNRSSLTGRPRRIRFQAPAAVQPSRLLRDRDGGLWIGTLDRGLLHVHQGRTDVFTQADGLSGDSLTSLFEDREGNIWVATLTASTAFATSPFPRFLSKQGLSVHRSARFWRPGMAVFGSALVDGLNRWNHGQITVYREAQRTRAARTARIGTAR